MAKREKPPAKSSRGSKRKGKSGSSRSSGGKTPFPGVPSKNEVLAFLKDNPDVHGRREIGRAFGVTGKARFTFKALMKEMAQEGLLDRDDDGQLAETATGALAHLPPVGMADIVSVDEDGELWAVAAASRRGRHGSDQTDDDTAEDDASGQGPLLRVCGLKRGPAPERLGVGDRVLARFAEVDEDGDDLNDEDGGSVDTDTPPRYEARVIKRIDKRPQTQLGIVSGEAGGKLRVLPVGKKSRDDYPLERADAGEAKPGDLVTITLEKPRGRRGYGRDKCARVVKAHGNASEPGSASLIAIQEEEIPTEFPSAALEEADAAKLPGMKGRKDMRSLPLLTIDPADARDHDDAVAAEADDDPANKGGYIVTVAIADVAAFVTPGSALDREARHRGNSVYFPDLVVPMLPEGLSAGLCSLQEAQDRPVMAVRMVFDASGQKRRHEFFRGMMKSIASLSYEQVQSAWDGEADDKTAPLLAPVLTPLFEAYRAVARAREDRQPLQLDIPERRISVDNNGVPVGVVTPPRLETHRLIEEFMVLANVAAAETLDRFKLNYLRRVHDVPAAEKIDGLAEFLRSLDLNLAKGQVMQPQHFNRLLREAGDGPNASAVHDAVLRAQSQAVYAPRDQGHFGLNLRRYAHFTSPIRRYADVIVHRALITALGLGDDGIDAATIASLDEIGVEISDTERRAMRAERSTNDRLIAHFLHSRLGAEFEGRVTGLVRSGLFVGLTETGADGYVGAATLGDDYYVADEALRAMVGERSGKGFRVGDTVTVKLTEADPLRGQIGFEMISEPRELRPPGKSGRSTKGRGGPSSGKRSASRASKLKLPRQKRGKAKKR